MVVGDRSEAASACQERAEAGHEFLAGRNLFFLSHARARPVVQTPAVVLEVVM